MSGPPEGPESLAAGSFRGPAADQDSRAERPVRSPGPVPLTGRPERVVLTHGQRCGYRYGYGPCSEHDHAATATITGLRRTGRAAGAVCGANVRSSVSTSASSPSVPLAR